MFRRTVPAELKAAAGRVIAASRAEDGAWVAATPSALVTLPEGGTADVVPWHDVLGGGWDRGAQALGARVRGGREILHRFPDDAPALVQAFRERVGASYVVTREVRTPQGVVHVSVRKNLATQELFEDVVAPGVDLGAGDVAGEVRRVRADLREQVGLSL